MRGHAPLVAMRRRGMRPDLVRLSDRPGEAWNAHPETAAHPEVYVEPDDSVQLLDLRFLVGLPVLVSVNEPTRLRSLVLACQDAGARVVYGCNPSSNEPAICTAGEDQSWRG